MTLLLVYSVLNASTGSFLLAILDGINPAIIVRTMLITTKIIAAFTGKTAFTVSILVKEWIILLIGILSNSVTTIPKIPAINPTINVSALNTLDISFLDAPIALKIPISFVLSKTDIYVIIPIIIEETTNEIATNAINT